MTGMRMTRWGMTIMSKMVYLNTLVASISTVQSSSYSCSDCVQHYGVVEHQDWKRVAEEILAQPQ